VQIAGGAAPAAKFRVTDAGQFGPASIPELAHTRTVTVPACPTFGPALVCTVQNPSGRCPGFSGVSLVAGQ
jgi:hypothetical protein